MTIQDIKEMYEGEYADIEVYCARGQGRYYPNCFLTDNCEYTEKYTEESEVGLYELMNEEEYECSQHANCDNETDFAEWYGDKKAKVLCIMLR